MPERPTLGPPPRRLLARCPVCDRQVTFASKAQLERMLARGGCKYHADRDCRPASGGPLSDWGPRTAGRVVSRAAPATVVLVPIDPALAKRVRAVATAAEKKRQERDELIFEAHEAGASLREIAALAGLSHVGVMKIVSKLEAEHIKPTSDEPQPDNLLMLSPEENRKMRRRE